MAATVADLMFTLLSLYLPVEPNCRRAAFARFPLFTTRGRAEGRPLPPNPLLVEPDVFHAQPVADAVDHHRVALHVRVPAGAGTAVIEDGPGDIFRQLLLDLPYQSFALFLVELHRLLID